MVDLNLEITALKDALIRLESRIHKLENHTEAPSPPPSDAVSLFWALDALKSRTSVEEREAVLFAGRISLDEGPVEWQQERSSENILSSEWGSSAAALGALGHPVRLELLRYILNGTRKTADLAALDILGTTGQLHHHLRQLVDAGWLQAVTRGYYEIPPARVIPLMTCIIAAGE